MPDSLLVHILDNSDPLVVSETHIFENKFVNVASSSYTIRDCTSMCICHLNLVCVHLIWFVVAVDHAETFWNIIITCSDYFHL